MKCMERERENRYQTVEELQADLAAYQGGYATRAQDANIFTLMRLLFQRNKKEVFMAGIALILVVLTGVAFLGKVKFSEIKAQEALKEAKQKVEELRQPAPSFAIVAEGELRKLQFTNALANVELNAEPLPADAPLVAELAAVLQAGRPLDGESAEDAGFRQTEAIMELCTAHNATR